MKSYLRNRWIRIGLALVLLGWGPLLAVGFLAKAGLLSDPNPNPVGPGLLFFFTFWPAILCLGVGIVQVAYRRAQGAAPLEQRPAASGQIEEPGQIPRGRLLLNLLGLGAALYLLQLLFSLAVGRVAGWVLAIAAVALYCAVRGRIPNWLRRERNSSLR